MTINSQNPFDHVEDVVETKEEGTAKPSSTSADDERRSEPVKVTRRRVGGSRAKAAHGGRKREQPEPVDERVAKPAPFPRTGDTQPGIQPRQGAPARTDKAGEGDEASLENLAEHTAPPTPRQALPPVDRRFICLCCGGRLNDDQAACVNCKTLRGQTNPPASAQSVSASTTSDPPLTKEDRRWHAIEGGVDTGPLDFYGVLKPGIQNGRFTAETLVWRAGRETWTPLQRVDSLRKFLPASSPSGTTLQFPPPLPVAAQQSPPPPVVANIPDTWVQVTSQVASVPPAHAAYAPPGTAVAGQGQGAAPQQPQTPAFNPFVPPPAAMNNPAPSAPATKFCTNCRTTLPGNAKFCTNCRATF